MKNQIGQDKEQIDWPQIWFKLWLFWLCEFRKDINHFSAFIQMTTRLPTANGMPQELTVFKENNVNHPAVCLTQMLRNACLFSSLFPECLPICFCPWESQAQAQIKSVMLDNCIPIPNILRHCVHTKTYRSCGQNHQYLDSTKSSGKDKTMEKPQRDDYLQS